MASPPPVPLILRFRDLVTGPGGTLEAHRSIIAARGFVWWGWWCKGGERVPLEHFAKLKRAVVAAPQDVLLFDTGQLKLYRAACSDIHWEPTGDRAPSPEPDATPDYYRDQPYRAWFKLTRIDEDEADAEVLREHSYVRVDEFFASGPSRYERFYSKRIFSAEELKQQDRTIWFVRPTQPQDPTHEVRLHDARETAPEHYAKRFEQSEFSSLLWVSDLHFSEDRSHHRFQTTAAADCLETALERAAAAHGVDLAGLLVSGDLTWAASEAEFELAFRSLNNLMDRLRIHRYQTAVCPGNHDVAFSATPAEKGAPVTEAADVARAGFAKFYRDLYYLAPNEHMASGRRFLLAGSIPVEVVALNSSALEQSPGLFQGHGFVGERQLDAAAEGMRWSNSQTVPAFRILMLHHHLVPVLYRQNPIAGQLYSVALDAGAILRWIVKHRVRLVLHGHMHQPFAARLSLPIDEAAPNGGWHEFSVVGLGSTGVAVDHLGASGQNTFAVLKFTATCVEMNTYTLHPTDPSTLLRTLRVPYSDSDPR